MASGNVGTSKIFENDRTIIWECALQPGESTPVHTHEHDYVFYVLDGAPLEVFDENGELLTVFEAQSGMCFPLNCEGDDLVSADDKGIRVPATHSARNAGDTPYREILVESKKLP